MRRKRRDRMNAMGETVTTFLQTSFGQRQEQDEEHDRDREGKGMAEKQKDWIQKRRIQKGKEMTKKRVKKEKKKEEKKEDWN